MNTTTTDRIEKQILLKAPRTRVWRAITDSKEFGAWFQAAFDGPFRPGVRLKCRITYPGYEHLVLDFVVEKMEPERCFSYRWHPNAVDLSMDYSKEPMTLVEFTLDEVEGGTLLKVVESGFDGIPITRRAEALKSNEGGWAGQMKAIENYLRLNP
jgi:uncharacterized protein YndB with AHSA1/START domain